MQTSELADLEDEANMPIEQLMAKYGYTANAEAAGPSLPSSSAFSDNESPPPQSPLPMDTDSPGPPPQATHQNPPKPPPPQAQVPDSSNSPTQRAAVSKAAAKNDAEAVTHQQAEQATAAGMDAFEYSQALAERRASGSQAGPSSLNVLVSGKYPA